MKEKILILLILCALCCALTARQSDSFTWEYLKSYPESVCEGVQAPCSWERGDYLVLAGILGGGTLLYIYDEAIRDFVQEQRTDTSDKYSLVLKQFGEGKYVLPAIGASILGGYVADSPKTMDTGLLCLKSFVLAQGSIQVLKLASQRRRPSAGMNNHFWAEGGFNRKHDSFPSGHTGIVWSIAPILAAQYPQQKWLAPTAYGIATLTSMSRIYDNRHWSSDVFAGAVIAYFSAQLSLKSTPRLSAQSDGKSINFQYNW
ncbi:MAG: phosphatase PAP2 family protein [Candidatus Cloacimonetes bacterium]|nr:phosphatase PAP2 family protein [Candidatus Cloacimonadota bacterium]